MVLYHPTAPEHFHVRNALLQKCLRPDPLPFPIEHEYPIVLAPEGSNFSYCMNHGESLCSHVNLWPRVVVDASGRELFRLGLVGNVATDPELQGKGYMRMLLSSLEELAIEQGLAALVLWSDLDRFYHKLGYSSVGSEWHFHFLPSDSASRLQLTEWEPRHLTESMLQRCLELRYPLPVTLQRSLADFKRLLSIPWLNLFVALKGKELRAFAFMGKGYDMMGVAHEWGASHPSELVPLLHHAGRRHDYEQVMLLAPGSLNETWRKAFQDKAYASERVPMAWVKLLGTERPRELDQLFIWGLDSI
jgi:predicted N-acetyltransferase YhbS